MKMFFEFLNEDLKEIIIIHMFYDLHLIFLNILCTVFLATYVLQYIVFCLFVNIFCLMVDSLLIMVRLTNQIVVTRTSFFFVYYIC